MKPLWGAIIAGPALWLVHLVGTASLPEHTCTSGGGDWAMHALTAATALPTLLAILYCLRVAREAPSAEPYAEAAATVPARTRFLALFGALTAAISLALILLEGSYVLFIDACR
jgi:hypothetical protein